MMKSLCLFLIAAFYISLPIAVAADETPLAARAAAILERNCLQCHRGAGSASKSKFDVRDVASMIESGVIVPDAPDDSMIWILAHRGTMPPRSQPQLARLIGDDSQILADWIKDGAKNFQSPLLVRTSPSKQL